MPLALMESTHSRLIRSSASKGPDPSQVQGQGKIMKHREASGLVACRCNHV